MAIVEDAKNNPLLAMMFVGLVGINGYNIVGSGAPTQEMIKEAIREGMAPAVNAAPDKDAIVDAAASIREIVVELRNLGDNLIAFKQSANEGIAANTKALAMIGEMVHDNRAEIKVLRTDVDNLKQMKQR